MYSLRLGGIQELALWLVLGRATQVKSQQSQCNLHTPYINNQSWLALAGWTAAAAPTVTPAAWFTVS
jgi:hypothetical protein